MDHSKEIVPVDLELAAFSSKNLVRGHKLCRLKIGNF